MKIYELKTKKNEGYAILFTVVVIGIISMITIGLSNAAYKQIILSSVARDSTTAFYQADIASECALFFDNEEDISGRADNLSYSLCSDKTLTFHNAGYNGSGSILYTLNPSTDVSDPTNIDKCFRINITKTETESLVTTDVEALGYNICNKSSMRTVERSLKVAY